MLLEIKHVKKNFGQVSVLKNISLNLEKGQVSGLIGENGAGIAFIHQEFNLFPNLSVSENLFVQDFPGKKVAGMRFIDRKKCRELTTGYLAEVGLSLDPDTLVERLTTTQRQMVEIAKSLISRTKLIIFDEPTTSLTAHETQKLFELIGRLKQGGTAFDNQSIIETLEGQAETLKSAA